MAKMAERFEEGWSDEREEQARAALVALAGGARACSATVFVSAGGSSWATEALWPGDGISLLALPRGRAELACAVEEALPGWQWSISTVPEAGAVWPLACFALSPIHARGDSDKVREAIKSVAGAPALLDRALDVADQAIGGGSARFGQLGLFGMETLARASGGGPTEAAMKAWRELRDLSNPRGPSPGVGLSGLAAALRARALSIKLGEACAPGPSATPMGRRI